jgi:hypothetical protein
MPSFIRFDDAGILIEVEPLAGSGDGLVETGIGDRVATTVAGLREALERTLTASGQAMVAAAQAISPAPTEIEVTFGVNATGEVGNIAICKGSGQANFAVRLTWREPPR